MANSHLLLASRLGGLPPGIMAGISQMSDDPEGPEPHPALLDSHWMPASSPCQRKSGESGAVGKPDARRSAPTAHFGSSFGQPPSPHGRPSPSSSARPHSQPPTLNDHPGLGAARRRPIRVRIASNNARGTATSASGNVTALAWWATLPPILISFSRSVVSVHVAYLWFNQACRCPPVRRYEPSVKLGLAVELFAVK